MKLFGEIIVAAAIGFGVVWLLVPSRQNTSEPNRIASVESAEASQKRKQHERKRKEDEAVEKARERITQYRNAEGWDRGFMKSGSLSRQGYVCGDLYGKTSKNYGWEFTVRYIYNPKTDHIRVLSWAMINHDTLFKREWTKSCV